MTRIIGTIEARMGSSRLPGKTLMPVFKNKMLLECVVSRFHACRTLDAIVVATTVRGNDDAIVEWCEEHRVPVFRGSEDDILERIAGAARHYAADAIVQMGADSAYLDFQLIDQLVTRYLSGRYDYVCNDLRLTYPLGIYGHVVRAGSLIELARRNDLSDKDRSDVVRYIWEHPNAYAICNVEAPAQFRHPELRLTIDYPEDLEQARKVYSYFGDRLFTTADILALHEQRPELFEATRGLVQQSAPFV